MTWVRSRYRNTWGMRKQGMVGIRCFQEHALVPSQPVSHRPPPAWVHKHKGNQSLCSCPASCSPCSTRTRSCMHLPHGEHVQAVAVRAERTPTSHPQPCAHLPDGEHLVAVLAPHGVHPLQEGPRVQGQAARQLGQLGPDVCVTLLLGVKGRVHVLVGALVVCRCECHTHVHGGSGGGYVWAGTCMVLQGARLGPLSLPQAQGFTCPQLHLAHPIPPCNTFPAVHLRCSPGPN